MIRKICDGSTIRQLLALLIGLGSCSLYSATDEGEQLFLANCAECHQPDGMGIPNIYPALAGNEVVTGSGVDVALVLIIGRGEMPSFDGSLNTADMAAIINYVRNAWGNSGDTISEQTISNLK